MSTQTGESEDDLGSSRKGSTDRMDIRTLGRQISREGEHIQRHREVQEALEASAPGVTAR